jgi:hypothetical protein
VMEITTEGTSVYLTYSIDDKVSNLKTVLVTTGLLGKAKMPRELFENPDGSPITFDTDYSGKKRTDAAPTPGPFENPGSGTIKIKVW